MWTAFSEISAAVRALGLSEQQFCQLPNRQGECILREIKATFLAGRSPFFWWEHYDGADFWEPPRQGYELLEALCPEPEVYLVPHGEDSECVYVSSPATISKVLGECAAFEYSLVGPKLDWIVTETHHESIAVLGDRAKAELRRIRA